jgi:DNA-binding response OmpR family regulator
METSILIIGNDPDTEGLLSRAFSGSGFQVFVIPESGNAVLPAGPVRPDLVIFDSLRPGTHAWHILERMRQLSSVPIIVLTNLEDSNSAVNSLDRGADYCLTKPFDVGELQARVRALMRRGQCAAQPAYTA